MQAEPLYALFREHEIELDVVEHPAVFTCEEAERWVPDVEGLPTKNLFLRDRKGERHFLVVVGDEKSVDLKALSQVLGCSKLSLGSADRLQRCLGVSPGSVTLLALMNDSEKQVELILDRPMYEAASLRCHPLVNTATVSLKREQLETFLGVTGHRIRVAEVPAREA